MKTIFGVVAFLIMSNKNRVLFHYTGIVKTKENGVIDHIIHETIILGILRIVSFLLQTYDD